MNTVKTLITFACRQLTTSTTPRLDAELIMAHVLGISRSALFAHLEEPLGSTLIEKFKSLLSRRSQGEPIAYLVQEKEFWSLPLKVIAHTFVPRPETECLVETILHDLPANKPRMIADLGTGTGAIALALANECPNWNIIATDISKKALQVAKENAIRLKLFNVEFRHGHWFQVISEALDAIVSNPPYIAENDPCLSGDGVRFEPEVALIAAEDGLAALKEIIQRAPSYLKPEGYLFLEHGSGQFSALKDLLEKAGFLKTKSIQDYAGIERVVVARK